MSDRHNLVTRHRRDVVWACYRLMLARDPDEAGGAHWLGFMVADGRVSDLVESLRVSDEAKTLAAHFRLPASREGNSVAEVVGADDAGAADQQGFASLNSRAQEFALRIAGTAKRSGEPST